MNSHRHHRLILLLVASGLFTLAPVASGQRAGYGWCYACNAYMPEAHDCVGLRSRPSPWRDNSPPVEIVPQKSQAQIDAENARAWTVQALQDMDAFKRTRDKKWLDKALGKLLNAEALLRRPSVYRGNILSVVNANIAWCYNEFAQLNYNARQWAHAEKYFYLAWKYNPDVEVYREYYRKAQAEQEAANQQAQIEQAQRQAGEANERGRKFSEQKKWEEAVRAFEEAVRLDPSWQGYRNNLNAAQEQWNRQLEADAARRAAEEQHRQEVATRLEQSREYTRQQSELRDTSVNERKQQAAEYIVDVKTPFGTDSYVGAQIPEQGGQVIQTRSAYKQAQTLRDMLKTALDDFQGLGKDTPVDALARLGYTAQQGSEAMQGGTFRGAVSGEELPKLTLGMPKLRAQIAVTAQHYKELAESVKVMTETTRKVKEAVQTKEIARQQVETAKAKIAEAEALPEDTEEAKKKKADYSAAAEAMKEAATKLEKEADELKAQAEKEEGEAQVELKKKTVALQAESSKLDAMLADVNLPEEKKKGTSEPPPQIPVKP